MLKKKGVLLLNLGTPDAPDVGSVYRYLRVFLMDRRVIDLPYVVRWPLVNLFILPFRSRNSAKLYQKIWQKKGSPLLTNTAELTHKLAEKLGLEYKVEFGMRYGKPSIEKACQALIDAQCDSITVLPLFPQYSSAATGSALAEVYKFMVNVEEIPSLRIDNHFYDDPAYIQTLSGWISLHLKKIDFDCLLFSYHGLPAKYMAYRKQCEITSSLLAKELHLSEEQYAFSFQSRLGKIEWLRPYTDELLSDLRSKGVKRLAVACPSFVADCLETLEEINMGIRERWLCLGGEQFHYVPCLNSESIWVETLAARF